MAGFNEILSGRFNRCLQKMLSMKGAASMNELATTIQPQVSFAWGNEMRFLESWNRFGIGVQIGPVAAQLNSFQFRNPLTSGVVAVIEKFSLVTAQAGPFDTFVTGRLGGQGVATPDLTTIIVNTEMRFDARMGAQQGSSVVSSQSSAAPPGVLGSPKLVAPVNNGLPWDDVVSLDQSEITVLPGDVWQVIGTTVNIPWFLSCWWRERVLEDSEKR